MQRRSFLQGSALAFGILRYLPACGTKTPGAGTAAERNFIAIRDRYFLKALELNPMHPGLRNALGGL